MSGIFSRYDTGIVNIAAGCRHRRTVPSVTYCDIDHAQTPAEAGKLLSRGQGGGYLLAALMPGLYVTVLSH